MKNLKALFGTILLVVLTAIQAFPQGESLQFLRIKDPKNPQRYGRGKINDISYVVHPKGIYTQVNCYFTFSSAATTFTSATDSLEITYTFDLPKGAVVTDSWLWVGDQIIRADIVDEWTADSVFEGIVKRREDPSILVKNENNNYELRVFPLVGNSTRKVMFTIMLLNTWSPDGTFGVRLPLTMLNAPANASCSNGCNSSGKPLSARLMLRKDSFFKLNQIEASTGSTYSFSQDLNSSYLSTYVNSGDFTNDFFLSFRPSKLKEGIFLNTIATKADTGFYQVVFLPSKTKKLHVPIKRKTVFLVDYQDTKSTVSRHQVYRSLKKLIESHYTEQDSFAIFFSGDQITGTGSNWIKGDSISKALAFSALSPSNIMTYSNLKPLLLKGVEFVKEKNGGDIVAVTASEAGFAPTSSTNKTINEIASTLPRDSKFSSVDLCNRYSNSYFYSGKYYTADGYFYSNLSRLAEGLSGSILDYPASEQNPAAYEELLTKAIDVSAGYFTSAEFYTTLLNGFCSGKQTFASSTQNLSVTTPFIQVGKYNGDMPFQIKASIIYRGATYYYTFNVGQSEVSLPDSATITAWEAKYIMDHESMPQTNPEIANIIQHSLKSRVLSKYTAFLALEPGMGGRPCLTCVDETGTILGLDEELGTDSMAISVYPCPAVMQATISLKTKASLSSNARLLIYNSIGDLIHEANLSELRPTQGRLRYVLDLQKEENITNGVYMVMFQDHGKITKGKLVIQK